jgi:hypothetical protein
MPRVVTLSEAKGLVRPPGLHDNCSSALVRYLLSLLAMGTLVLVTSSGQPFCSAVSFSWTDRAALA